MCGAQRHGVLFNNFHAPEVNGVSNDNAMLFIVWLAAHRYWFRYSVFSPRIAVALRFRHFNRIGCLLCTTASVCERVKKATTTKSINLAPAYSVSAVFITWPGPYMALCIVTCCMTNTKHGKRCPSHRCIYYIPLGFAR